MFTITLREVDAIPENNPAVRVFVDGLYLKSASLESPTPTPVELNAKIGKWSVDEVALRRVVPLEVVANPETFPVRLPDTLPVTFPETLPVTFPETFPVRLPETFPVTDPDTLPVTFPETVPVTFPENPEAVSIPVLGTTFNDETIETPDPEDDVLVGLNVMK